MIYPLLGANSISLMLTHDCLLYILRYSDNLANICFYFDYVLIQI